MPKGKYLRVMMYPSETHQGAHSTVDFEGFTSDEEVFKVVDKYWPKGEARTTPAFILFVHWVHWNIEEGEPPSKFEMESMLAFLLEYFNAWGSIDFVPPWVGDVVA